VGRCEGGGGAEGKYATSNGSTVDWIASQRSLGDSMLCCLYIRWSVCVITSLGGAGLGIDRGNRQGPVDG